MRDNKNVLWSSNFILICLSSFFVFITFYILAASLPVFVKENLGGSEEQIGLTMTIFIIASVLARLFAGTWISRFGERKMVFISLLLFFIASAYYLNIYSLVILFVLRFVHGGSFAVSTTSTTAVALRLIPANRKGEGISYFSLFMSLAMVIGPFIGLTINSHFGFRVLFIICGFFALLALVFALLTRSPKIEAAPRAAKGKLHWRDLIEPSVIPVGLAGFVLAFAYSGLTSFISVYASDLSIGAMAGYFFVCFGIMIVIPRPLVGKILDKYGEHVIVYPCIVAFTIGMILLGLAHTPAMFLLAGAICGLGYGSMLPCFQTIAVKKASVHRQALATATFFVLFDSGYGVGSYVLGLLAESSGYAHMYLISAVIVAFTAVIYFALHHRRNPAAIAEPSSAK
ncbi:MFS transporter [Paenibacillus aestuarii]|uniref:MFS transporter n=1 Tax=Paenibacillus aestuarii TaxID=516965 RepID=A0ABW0KG45_9BACL|nr:MFS transporter [Paenibacillus aestuarii]